MNAVSKYAEALRAALDHPTSGIIGIVDTLLKVRPDQEVHLHWQPDCCEVQCRAAGYEAGFETPLRQSVFRAIVARVSAICSQDSPGSMSPYGGESKLCVSTDQAAWVRVKFENTPDSQWLSLTPLSKAEEIEELRRQNAELRAKLAARSTKPPDIDTGNVWPEMQQNYYDSFIA